MLSAQTALTAEQRWNLEAFSSVEKALTEHQAWDGFDRLVDRGCDRGLLLAMLLGLGPYAKTKDTRDAAVGFDRPQLKRACND